MNFLDRLKKWEVGVVESDGCLVDVSSAYFTKRGAQGDADNLQKLESMAGQSNLTYVVARRT